jgi:predicted DNA binding CopG/RHH family protein
MHSPPLTSFPEPVSSESPSFLSVLAALAAPDRSEPDTGASPRRSDDLRDDIATLSYEYATRSYGDGGVGRRTHACEDSSLESAPDCTTEELSRRSASITIRVSEQENVQLRTRAAEAGLTISAYLRSCTFEAEALRAQVKTALAELRKASTGETRFAAPPAERAPRRWWRLRPQAESRAS